MKAELLSERTEFLQWCFDMLKFYRDRTNKCGEKLTLFRANGLMLLTDDAYNQWLESKQNQAEAAPAEEQAPAEAVEGTVE